MPHFIVELTYTAPLAQVDAITAEHRTFLQTGYDQGLLLYSGRQVPPAGGIVVARAESRAALEAFFARDPYQQQGLATYLYIEFVPVRYQGFLQEWVAGA